MKIKLTSQKIDQIVEQSGDLAECLVNLYKTALPNWDNIKIVKHYPIVSEATAWYILDQMSKKYGDGWAVKGLWLNKGFSHDEVPDWTIIIPKNCYELII